MLGRDFRVKLDPHVTDRREILLLQYGHYVQTGTHSFSRKACEMSRKKETKAQNDPFLDPF
jgi:hypothetical protein